MGTCSACRHPNRGEIDRLIVQKTPYRQIARTFGLTKSALHRHRRRHMERVFRKAALRLEAADGYNADTIFERLQTLSTTTINVLGKAIASQNLAVAIGAIRTARDHLSFEAELLGQLKGAHNEVRLNVVYGHGARPQLLDGKECPTCRRVVDMKAIDRQYTLAVRRALGLLEDGEREPSRSQAGHSGTEASEELPVGVDEVIGGFRTNREQPRQESQVVQAKVVRPTPVPARPALPPHEPESNLKVAVNKSFFSGWKQQL
jgi:hypothetical protein